MSTVVETLTKARTLLENYGWIQEDVGGAETGFCALGAVTEAVELCSSARYDAYYAARSALMYTVQSSEFGCHDGVIQFNDAPGRTKEEVLNLFNQTIARLEAEQ